MSFDGFNKYLQEKDIQNYSLIIDKEGKSEEESKTLKSAREIGLDNSDEADSTEHPGLRMADMMAGIISKLLKGLCDSLRYQSLDESTNKKILDVGWFCLSEVQLKLYKKLYRLICEWQPAWYKSYSGIYSDDLVVFNALLNFMNRFESVEQIRADIDMQGEYFNAFACEQLARYFDQRRCKLPIEPVILFDKESYLNQRGGKVYFDSRKQLLLPLHQGSQTFDVLSVGVDQKFTPIVTILKNGESECFRLPNELSEYIVQTQCKDEFTYDVTLLLNCLLGLVSLPTERTRSNSTLFKNECVNKLKIMGVIIKSTDDDKTFRTVKNALSHMNIATQNKDGAVDSIIIRDRQNRNSPVHTELHFTVPQLREFALFVADKHLERLLNKNLEE